MSARQLSRIFRAAAFKRLGIRDVTTNPQREHVLLDVQPLVALFGSYARAAISVHTYWFNDEGDTIAGEATLKWSKQHRSDEVPSRLAFAEGEVTDTIEAGSGIVIATRRNGPAILAVVRPDSTIENQLCWLFGMTNAPRNESCVVRRFPADHDAPLNFAANYILGELFINPDPPSVLHRSPAQGPVPHPPPLA